MERSPATVEYTEEDNDRGFPQDCVYVECSNSGYRVGPIWGHGEASVRRALAQLTEECSCGAAFHSDSTADDF